MRVTITGEKGKENRTQHRREILLSAVLSLLFSIFLVAGWQMESKGQYVFFSPWPHAAFLVLLLVFFPLVLWSLRTLHQWEGSSSHGRPGRSRPRRFFLLRQKGDDAIAGGQEDWIRPRRFFLLRQKGGDAIAEGQDDWIRPRRLFLLRQGGLVLCWIPALLAGYPGFFCYDATYQFNEVATGVYDLHHPLLHTWLLGKSLTLSEAWFGSYEAGVLVFCVLQMLAITACFCFVLQVMDRRGAGRWLVRLSYIYYALYPTCVLFGLCTTKDSLFTAFMTLHLVFVFELAQDGESFFRKPLSLAFYVGTAVLAMLFRNNGIYSYLLFLPFLLLLTKGARKKAAALAVGSMALSLLLTQGMAALLGAEDKNGLREMLSVPAQQLARTHQEEGRDFFTKEDRDRLYSFISEEDLGRYNAKLADPVKANLHVGLNSTLPDFFLLWLRTGLRSPGNYLDALLLQTYQAWYPFTVPDGYCGENAKPRYQGSESCYFALEAEEPVTASSKLPGLLEGYRFFSRHMTFGTVPVVPVFFSIGTLFWILLYALAYALCYEKRGASALLLMVLCLCLTCLLGPIVLVRYYLILFFALPLVVGCNKLL